MAEIQGLQAQSEQGLTEHEAESRRQRLEAYFEEGSTALMYAAALRVLGSRLRLRLGRDNRAGQ